jgi:large subunit ribosomal protein L5
MAARLFEKYKNEIKPVLESEFAQNKMLTAKVEKVTISVGTGFAAKDSKLMQNINDTISLIAGQKAVTVISKKSVAGFKVREGMPVGVKVTLRGSRMYEFLDKLVTIALPRVKDFRGLNRNGFDGSGNFNFGLDEQLMFPEVEFDNIIQTHGMNISITTSTSSDEESFRLLELMGVPFTKGRAA